jgi:hypothetical protein
MQQFSGIAEKLVRAKENLFNLYSEIERFFEEGDYPVLPQNDRKALLKAIAYHKNRVIPPRFAVLSGELIHHLRSCFDHVAWHFSVLPVKNVRKIEFPVFEAAPINHDGRKLFEGKIAGIADTNARALIERLQPHNAADPLNDPLWIIHDFDIVDKHRELVVCAGIGRLVVSVEMGPIIESYKRAHPELNPAQIARHFDRHGTTQPSVSFRNFGRREIQPVIPGLTELFNYTVEVVKQFEIL